MTNQSLHEETFNGDYCFKLTRTGSEWWVGYGHVVHVPTGLSRSYFEAWNNTDDKRRAVGELTAEVGRVRVRRGSQGFVMPTVESVRDPVYLASLRNRKI